MRPIQVDQQLLIDRPERVEMTQLLERAENVLEHREHALRRDVVQQIPDVVIRGDLLQTKQGLRITDALGFGHHRLMGKKGRTLCEKHGKCRQRNVFHAVTGILTRSLIRELLNPMTELSCQMIEGEQIARPL